MQFERATRVIVNECLGTLPRKDRGKVRLRSRNDKDFTSRYPAVVKALSAMPDRTVIDGEIVALDQNGKPSFSRNAPIHRRLALESRSLYGHLCT